MGIFLIEDLVDLLCMGMVLGEDDSLAQLLTVVDLDAFRHQHMKHLTDGIRIEDPLVQRGGNDLLRQLTVFIGEGILVCFPLLFRQIFISNAGIQEL